MKKILKNLSYLVVAVLVGVTAVYAGDLTPPGVPTKTMKSLSDLYELIDTGANTPSTDFTTPTTVSSTMNSLKDIYDLMVNKIASIDSATILTGTTIFGVEGEGTFANPAPIFASTYARTYRCDALATDPDQPELNLQTICEYHTEDGCSWSGSACEGGTRTPVGGIMTWYSATASCSEKIDEGSTSWRLPTYPEMVKYYVEYNQTGYSPDPFRDDSYWSNTISPIFSDRAYVVGMGNGIAGIGSKSNLYPLAVCAR